jgi:FKBP-type peptidyl-prolyl cis-trans isomerase
MKHRLIVLTLLALVWYACAKKERVRQEMIPPSNGMSILYHARHLDGRKPRLKDILLLRYVYIGPFGDTLVNTYKMSPPEPYSTVKPKDYVEQELLLPPYPGAIEEALAGVAVGDSLTVFLHQDSVIKRTGYKAPKSGSNPFICPKMPFRYVIKVLGIMTPEEKETYMQWQANMQIAKQDSVLALYVKNYAFKKAVRDPTGLYIQVDKEGVGDLPQPGDSISFIYSGHFLNQQFFDTMEKPQGFRLGVKRLIPAWEIAFSKYLRKGSLSTIMVPSHLAFGHKGKDKIPPFTPLVFRIEVLDVVKAKDLPKYRK